ncbi:MAG: hypothetical protein L6R48_25055 [Planctomycetes bacterium]|nr:hypothetical protein [Planctomycetota bacterium]
MLVHGALPAAVMAAIMTWSEAEVGAGVQAPGWHNPQSLRWLAEARHRLADLGGVPAWQQGFLTAHADVWAWAYREAVLAGQDAAGVADALLRAGGGGFVAGSEAVRRAGGAQWRDWYAELLVLRKAIGQLAQGHAAAAAITAWRCHQRLAVMQAWWWSDEAALVAWVADPQRPLPALLSPLHVGALAASGSLLRAGLPVAPAPAVLAAAVRRALDAGLAEPALRLALRLPLDPPGHRLLLAKALAEAGHRRTAAQLLRVQVYQGGEVERGAARALLAGVHDGSGAVVRALRCGTTATPAVLAASPWLRLGTAERLLRQGERAQARAWLAGVPTGGPAWERRRRLVAAAVAGDRPLEPVAVLDESVAASDWQLVVHLCTSGGGRVATLGLAPDDAPTGQA